MSDKRTCRITQSDGRMFVIGTMCAGNYKVRVAMSFKYLCATNESADVQPKNHRMGCKA